MGNIEIDFVNEILYDYEQVAELSPNKNQLNVSLKHRISQKINLI